MSEEYKQGMNHERELSTKAVHEVLYRIQDLGCNINIEDLMDYYNSVLKLLETKE